LQRLSTLELQPSVAERASDPSRFPNLEKLLGQVNYAMRGGTFGLGTDEETVESALDEVSRDPAYVQAFNTQYQKRYGTPLESHLRRDFSGDELEQVLALARGDRFTAKVHELRRAF